MSEKRVPCKYCKELISSEAEKCPFCQSILKKKISIGKVILILLGSLILFFVICVVYMIYIMLNVDNKFTGQELFNAVNEHRKNVGIQELQLDEKLCSNLTERWLAIREPEEEHKSFIEWAESEGFVENGIAKDYKLFSELYAGGSQTYWLIDSWANSPETSDTLNNPNFNIGCAYADKGTGVVIFAEK